VVDLFLRRARQLDLSSLAKQGYVVATHTLTVHGICQVCAARRRTSRSQRPATAKAQPKWRHETPKQRTVRDDA
jgi:hypothetical protein